MDFLDAPISGSPQKARDGSLTIICGGAQEAYDSVEPIMKAMASHVRLMGGHGAGTAAKLVSKARPKLQGVWLQLSYTITLCHTLAQWKVCREPTVLHCDCCR